jgi:hypothetical protein
MKMEGRWAVIVWVVIAGVGISGIIEALPHASESYGDLALDAVVLAAVMAISALIARQLRARRARKS